MVARRSRRGVDTVRSEALADGERIHVGEVDVEDHEVGMQILCGGQPGGSGPFSEDPIPSKSQRLGEELTDGIVVFDDEQRRGRTWFRGRWG